MAPAKLATDVKLTTTQQTVWEILQAATQPLSAYGILELLAQHHPNPKPPTVYRALQALQANGLVHKINSLNAFVVCRDGHQGHHHASAFLVCDDCGNTTELCLSALDKPLKSASEQAGFAMHNATLEMHGQCGDCQA